jgi:dTDP-4-dehydrorhamnose reductase
LVKEVSKIGVYLLYLSTDYVFSGEIYREDNILNLVNYGLTKPFVVMLKMVRVLRMARIPR